MKHGNCGMTPWNKGKYRRINVKAKYCSICHSLKSITEYSNNTHSVDGHVSQCKECDCVRKKEIAQLNKDLCMKHYGPPINNGYCCVCCGETIKSFLLLDHITQFPDGR